MVADSVKYSIIVRAYNEEQHIGRLLTGISEQKVQDVEVIVVDSGSSDHTASIAQSYRAQVVSIAPEDFTFGRSLNLGCSHASGEYLVFASAHVYPVYPDWLENLTAPFADPTVALVYGKQRGNSQTHFSEAQHFAKLYPEQTVLDQQGPFCNNANAAIRRELWQERSYDEELPGLEDLEWAMWARGKGQKVAYVAEAEVVHIHEETPKQVFNRYRREAIALKRLRPHEHFGIADFARLYISSLASDTRHALREGALPRAFPSMLWFRLAQFWGTYRGFVHRGQLSPDLKQAFYYPRTSRGVQSSESRPVTPIDYSKSPADSEGSESDTVEYSEELTEG